MFTVIAKSSYMQREITDIHEPTGQLTQVLKQIAFLLMKHTSTVPHPVLRMQQMWTVQILPPPLQTQTSALLLRIHLLNILERKKL